MTRANTKKSSGTKQRGVARSKPHSKPELVLETQISPNLAWMFPYLRRIQSKMPNLVLPKKIRSHKPNTQKIMRVLGNAYCHNQTIVIATHNQVTYLNRKGELRVKRIVRLPKEQAKLPCRDVIKFPYELIPNPNCLTPKSPYLELA